jgi:arylsulfatase A-like enzyme
MRRVSRAGLWGALAAVIVTACAPPAQERAAGPRPSILLFVYDTVRRDGTSVYGAPAGATPVLARLARDGLVYENAYANAPWTLPSHLSLFTGLLPSVHGVGVRSVYAADDLVLLAETLTTAGYDTRILSENPWVGAEFNVTQGFARVGMLPEKSLLRRFKAEFATLLADRDPTRPLFLVVNVMDAHGPFKARATEPFLLAGADVPTAIRRYSETFCKTPSPVDTWRPTVWGLYLGGVARADAKLGVVLARLRDEARPLVTIATADHGEHFGEHALTHHIHSVREPVIRIPLVVHGTDAPPARIASAVGLVNVHASILEWARAEQESPAAPLPVARDGTTGEVVVSEYFDTATGVLADESTLLRRLGVVRTFCKPEDRVFGDMRAVIRHPDKLIAFSRYPAELYEVGRDPGEHHDLATTRPEVVAELTRHLERVRDASLAAVPDAREPSAETTRRLRALGYLPPDEQGEPTSGRP